jgi:hypothetical protein
MWEALDRHFFGPLRERRGQIPTAWRTDGVVLLVYAPDPPTDG